MMTFRPVFLARVFRRSRRTTSYVLPRALISFRRLCHVGIALRFQWSRGSFDADEDLLSWPLLGIDRERWQRFTAPSCFAQTHITKGLLDLVDRSRLHVTSLPSAQQRSRSAAGRVADRPLHRVVSGPRGAGRGQGEQNSLGTWGTHSATLEARGSV